MYRVRHPGGVVWFKVCAPHQAFEVALTAGLSARHGSVTDVIAHDLGRRWLLMADAGQTLRMLGNPPERWLQLLPLYAALQIEEVRHVPDHLDAGVPDLRVPELPGRLDELLDAALPMAESERASLRAFASTFASLCAELDGSGIASSVQHDDLHMNNVYALGDVLRVLDWGDACVGHPFFSLFETFRFLEEMNGLRRDDPWFARLRDAYLEPWGSDRRETFELAVRVGGIAHAAAWLRQRDALPVAERPAFDEAFAVILRIALRDLRIA